MSKKEFHLPPISPLLGSGLRNYLRITSKGHIHSKFVFKYILTGLIIGILTPFRWIEKWKYRKIEKFPLSTPVFITGHWRSGTTFLHNLLCQSEEAAYISTYQTVFTEYLASRALLAPFMRYLMPDHRPGDNMTLAVNAPQEEEFVMCNSSEYSYYHFFYFPELVDNYFREAVLFENASAKQWADDYESILKKAQTFMPESTHIIVKNPVNSGRITELMKKFPDARFINIRRNPYIVFLSTKKFFTELMPTLWFNPISEEEIEILVLERFVTFMEKYEREYAQARQLIDIRFEDFEKDPMEYVEQIYRQLGLPGFEKARVPMEKYVTLKKNYQKNKYSISRREVLLVQKHWGAFLERWNYELPENIVIMD